MKKVNELVEWIKSIINKVINWITENILNTIGDKVKNFLKEKETEIKNANDPVNVAKAAGINKAIQILAEQAKNIGKNLDEKDRIIIINMFNNEINFN